MYQEDLTPASAARRASGSAEIDATDKLIRALDAVREAGGLTKAQLARRIEAKPESIRRLFTAPDSNPTMETVRQQRRPQLPLDRDRPFASMRVRRDRPQVAEGSVSRARILGRWSRCFEWAAEYPDNTGELAVSDLRVG